MTTLHKYDGGIIDETGKIIALKAHNWWYTPAVNKLGLPELEACSKVQSDAYEAMPTTARRIERVMVPRPRPKTIKGRRY
ncbi:MAG: hypothetical protein WC683_02575 [bacterium]